MFLGRPLPNTPSSLSEHGSLSLQQAPCTGRLAEGRVLFTLLPPSQMRGATWARSQRPPVGCASLRWAPCSRGCGASFPGGG